MKKFTIITPCLNAEQHIGETIESVVGQSAVLSGRAELEYLICDGASTDNTLKIASSYSHPGIQVISQSDTGMYAALASGLCHASGDIVAYINAGDLYCREAFDVVLDIFEKADVQWLTGFNVHYNAKSQIVQVKLPYNYRREFFKVGLYGRFLIFVQQESTFWSAELNKSIDFDILSRFRFAGDYYLWRCFAEQADLKIVEAYLGGFRIQSGQLSENIRAYREEMESICCRPSLRHYMLAMIDRVMWYAPTEWKKICNRKGLFRYNHKLQDWL